MNLLFDLEAVRRGVTSYDRMLQELDRILEDMTSLVNGIPKRTWSGEGRATFHQAFETWKNRTRMVRADLEKTREGLVKYGANGAIELKKYCEDFGDVY